MLKDHTSKISNGEYSSRIELKTEDEFSTLAINFNAMAKTIEEKNVQLNTYAEDLENKIEKRTLQLKELNEVLEEKNRDLIFSNSEFIELLDSTLESIFIINNSKITMINNEAVKLIGYSQKKDILSLDIKEFIDKKSTNS